MPSKYPYPNDPVDDVEPLIIVAVPSFQDRSSAAPPAASDAYVKFAPSTINKPNDPVDVAEPEIFGFVLSVMENKCP